MKKNGSATLIVILFSTIYMLYTASVYADVRHMKKTYDNYKEELVDMYEKKYQDDINLL